LGRWYAFATKRDDQAYKGKKTQCTGEYDVYMKVAGENKKMVMERLVDRHMFPNKAGITTESVMKHMGRMNW
jgi:hypothetical protein